LDIPQKKPRGTLFTILSTYLDTPQCRMYCDFNVTSIIIPLQNRTGPY